MGHEYGIGVRNGCFCAHPYILHLLGLNQEEANEVRDQIQAGDRSDMPGLVRVSFGLYNSTNEIDELIESLFHILRGDYAGNYLQDPTSGEYFPEGWDPEFDRFFSIPDLID